MGSPPSAAPSNPPNSTSIPIFDLSFRSAGLATSLTRAAHEYGFLYLRTPSLFPTCSISRMFSVSSSFFHSPHSLKIQYPMQANNRGWAAMHAEGLDPAHQPGGDPKEAFNFGEFGRDGKAEQPLPPVFVAAEHEIAEFQARCRDVCLQVLELIAEGLEIEGEAKGDGSINGEKDNSTAANDDKNLHSERKWFATRHDPAHGPSGTILRLLHYPAPTASSGKALRAGAHSDYGSLTLLFRQRGDAGLEIQPPRSAQPSSQPSDSSLIETSKAEEWLRVPVCPPGTEPDSLPPVLVNIGDLLSYWTRGWLRSTVHRVVMPMENENKERYSIAYFCHPIQDTPLVPVPSRIIREHVGESQDETREGKILTATEHLQSRLKATYGWKEEVKTA